MAAIPRTHDRGNHGSAVSPCDDADVVAPPAPSAHWAVSGGRIAPRFTRYVPLSQQGSISVRLPGVGARPACNHTRRVGQARDGPDPDQAAGTARGAACVRQRLL